MSTIKNKTFTVMGCGNSSGTPSIGNYWGNCDPDNPKNRRLRPSVLVRSDKTSIVIDTGPDFREQSNTYGVSTYDAALYTHSHADHINGIDELRVLRQRHKKLIDIYGHKASMEELEDRFDYLFREKAQIYPQVLQTNVINESQFGQEMTIGDITFTPFEQDHGTCKSLGFRFGDIGYSTDMIDLPEKSLDVLKGIKTWIVDGAGYNFPQNEVHCRLKDVYQFNDIIGAEKIYLTHLSVLMDYDTLNKETPDGYEAAYDGLELKF